MKITSLIAAAALATVSTAAVADVATDAGDLVIIEKNAGPALGLAPGLLAAGIAVTIIGIAAIGSDSESET